MLYRYVWSTKEKMFKSVHLHLKCLSGYLRGIFLKMYPKLTPNLSEFI